MAGLRFRASNLASYFFFAFRARGGAVGVVTTNFHGIRGCGERDAPDFVCRSFEELLLAALLR